MSSNTGPPPTPGSRHIGWAITTPARSVAGGTPIGSRLSLNTAPSGARAAEVSKIGSSTKMTRRVLANREISCWGRCQTKSHRR